MYSQYCLCCAPGHQTDRKNPASSPEQHPRLRFKYQYCCRIRFASLQLRLWLLIQPPELLSTHRLRGRPDWKSACQLLGHECVKPRALDQINNACNLSQLDSPTIYINGSELCQACRNLETDIGPNGSTEKSAFALHTPCFLRPFLLPQAVLWVPFVAVAVDWLPSFLIPAVCSELGYHSRLKLPAPSRLQDPVLMGTIHKLTTFLLGRSRSRAIPRSCDTSVSVA